MHHRRSPGRRAAVGGIHRVPRVLLALMFLTALPATIGAQSPEAVAQEYLDALRRLRWDDVADRLHTGILTEFHLVSRQLVENRAGDSILVQLYESSRGEWDGWTSREVFVRSMEGVTRYARGLVESLVMTEVRILGTVPEGDTIRHVVYREITDHMGTVIEGVLTLSLVLEEGRWRVRENAELDVLLTALRGIPIGRGARPGPELTAAASVPSIHPGPRSSQCFPTRR